LNGIDNILPSKPAQLYLEEAEADFTPCDPNEESLQHTQCSHVVEFPLGSIVQLIVQYPAIDGSKVFDMDGLLAGSSHPMHIHGFTPRFVGVGFPEYAESGPAKAKNADIHNFPGLIFNGEWTDQSWNNGNYPHHVGPQAPFKDTFMVPIGGYLVLQFKADNPGYWMFHCHTLTHTVGGQNAILKIGETSDMPKTPESLKQCGRNAFSQEDFLKAIGRAA